MHTGLLDESVSTTSTSDRVPMIDHEGILMSEPNTDSPDLAKLSPEALAKIAGVKAQVHSSFGQVVLAMSSVPRYWHQSLNEYVVLIRVVY